MIPVCMGQISDKPNGSMVHSVSAMADLKQVCSANGSRQQVDNQVHSAVIPRPFCLLHGGIQILTLDPQPS